MSLSILRDIVESIINANFYSIMVDETSHASNKKHTVFCVRYVVNIRQTQKYFVEGSQRGYFHLGVQ